MKKLNKEPLLYRFRFQIGYFFLILAFFALLTFLPNVAPNGISNQEMNSVVAASNLDRDFLSKGEVINLPYYMLQKASLYLFGLSIFSIKLPSIIIGTLAGLFIVLLINRWFKSDVAIFGSILTTLSTAFLFLSTSGTPTIMYIFWLSLILWLGSKIVGNNKTHPLLVISFFFSVAASLYTPHLCYVAIAIAIAGITHPHLRFAMKQIKLWQTILSIAVFVATIIPIIIAVMQNHALLTDFFFMRDFNFNTFFANMSEAFAPFFSFSLAYDSIYLAPLFGLATVALVLIGTLAILGELFTSRNTVISLIIIFSIIFSGLNQDVAILIVIPIAILSAAGIESIFKKWYSLFPENPYAHFIGNFPILVISLMIIISGLSHFIYGYRYTPSVASNFSEDLSLINNLPSGSILVIDRETENYDFYKLVEKYNSISILDSTPERNTGEIVYYAKTSTEKNLKLKQIITSPKSRNSARLYIYETISDNNQGE